MTLFIHHSWFIRHSCIKALAEIADIYLRMTSIHDSSLFDGSFAMDFINHGDKIIYCAMYLYVGYINETTNFAESQGGGGSYTKNWGVIRMKMK